MLLFSGNFSAFVCIVSYSSVAAAAVQWFGNWRPRRDGAHNQTCRNSECAIAQGSSSEARQREALDQKDRTAVLSVQSVDHSLSSSEPGLLSRQGCSVRCCRGHQEYQIRLCSIST